MMIAASLYAPKIAAAFAAVLVYLAIMSPRPVGADVPVQKYYLPLSEDHLLDSMTLVNTASNSPVTSLTAITVSSPNTIIYVDHWEDGYEADILSPTSADTEIWGDNNAANGCSPAAIEAAAPNPCSDADDVLTPGTAIVIQNDVPVNPRDPTYRSGGKFVTDGGDIIASSFPIAITRGGYPTGPGSLLGGAVEVVNTDGWGTTFFWPGATDLVTLETDAGNAAMDSFELTDVFIMAREDGTEVRTPAGIDAVTRPDGVSDTSGFAASYILNAGESVRFEGIKLADRKVTADKPVQAALITGEKGSRYDMRWYSLVPVEQWSESYYTPVGSIDTRVYFTAENAMTINYDNINGTNQGSFDIPAGGIAQFDLANGSGFKFHSQNAGDKFFGITQTDISDGGSASDWGHPLIPGHIMTSQVLLGLAYACTDNTCESDKYYSPVWLTAIDNANIHIDYDSNGIPDEIVTVAALQSIYIEDTNDKDMTGATIWATETDGSGDRVDIAVAWGQDPDYPTDSVQSKMLDMSTVVLPLPIIESFKTCVVEIDNDNNGALSPGDTLICTIRITNTGQADISNLQVCEDLADHTTYVRDSTSYESSADAPISISDHPTSEPYPLSDCHLFDGGFVLQTRSALEISYQIKLDPSHQIPDNYDAVVGTGYVTGSSDTYAEFDSRDAITKGSNPPKTAAAPTSPPSSSPTSSPVTPAPVIERQTRALVLTSPTATPVSASPTASPSVSSSPTASPVSSSPSSSLVVSSPPSAPVSALQEVVILGTDSPVAPTQAPTEGAPLLASQEVVILGTDSPVAPTQAPTEGGPLLAADEPVFSKEADAGATFTPTSAPAPAYGAAAPSINNTVCTTVNMTATHSIEIRSFMFYVETNECITVSVLYKGEGDTNWTPLCAEHDVVGQYPNATVVDHTYCTMVPLLDGETVEFRVQTSPSTTGCAEGDGSVTPIYQPLELMYTYSQMECT